MDASDHLLLAHFDPTRHYTTETIHKVLIERVGLSPLQADTLLSVVFRGLQRAGYNVTAEVRPEANDRLTDHPPGLLANASRIAPEKVTTNSIFCIECKKPVRLGGFRHCAEHITKACKKIQKATDTRQRAQLEFIKSFTCPGMHIWVFDAEFWEPGRNLCPLVLSVAIRSLQDNKVIINCTVDYDGMAVGEILQTLRGLFPQLQDPHEHHINGLRKGFENAYGRGSASRGRTCTDIRSMILRAGYDPMTHLVLAYNTSGVDQHIFWRLLQGSNQPFFDKSQSQDFLIGTKDTDFCSISSISICGIVKSCKISSGAGLARAHGQILGATHKETAHQPTVDTMRLIDILRILMLAG